METHRKKVKRTSKEAMDRWSKAGIRETKGTKLGEKIQKKNKSRGVEGDVGGGKNSRRVVMPMKKKILIVLVIDFKIILQFKYI
jgi:hypothetical protein